MTATDPAVAGEPARSRPLKVGVQLPEVERVVRWPELADMARAAEDIGLDSLWVGDHLLYRDAARGAVGPWEAWTTLAGLAAVTTRIELGPLVAATGFHNPAMLAKQASTVDEISGGRLIVGLGAGWNEVEYTAFGFPFDQRISRFEEAFTIIRTLLSEGAIDFDGRFYQVRDCELQPRGLRAGWPAAADRLDRPADAAHQRAVRARLERLVQLVRQRPGGPCADCTRVLTRPVARPAATRPRSNAPWPSWCACPVRSGRVGASVAPVEGTPEQMADALRAFAARRHRARPAGAGPHHGRLDQGAGPGAGAARDGLRWTRRTTMPAHARHRHRAGPPAPPDGRSGSVRPGG